MEHFHSVKEKPLSQSGHLENKQKQLLRYDVSLHKTTSHFAFQISLSTAGIREHLSPQPVDKHVHTLCTLMVIERHHILIKPQKCI